MQDKQKIIRDLDECLDTLTHLRSRRTMCDSLNGCEYKDIVDDTLGGVIQDLSNTIRVLELEKVQADLAEGRELIRK